MLQIMLKDIFNICYNFGDIHKNLKIAKKFGGRLDPNWLFTCRH